MARKDVVQQLQERDQTEREIRRLARESGRSEVDLAKAVEVAVNAYRVALADAKIRNNPELAELARAELEDARAALADRRLESSALEQRLREFRARTTDWLYEGRELLDAELRKRAAPVAMRQRQATDLQAQADAETDALRLLWQRLEDASAVATNRRSEDVRLDAVSKTPVSRSDVTTSRTVQARDDEQAGTTPVMDGGNLVGYI
jgi:hypothetical protein